MSEIQTMVVMHVDVPIHMNAGAEVEALDGNHRTALLIAARYGHAEIIRILIEAGVFARISRSSV